MTFIIITFIYRLAHEYNVFWSNPPLHPPLQLLPHLAFFPSQLHVRLLELSEPAQCRMCAGRSRAVQQGMHSWRNPILCFLQQPSRLEGPQVRVGFHGPPSLSMQEDHGLDFSFFLFFSELQTHQTSGHMTYMLDALRDCASQQQPELRDTTYTPWKSKQTEGCSRWWEHLSPKRRSCQVQHVSKQSQTHTSWQVFTLENHTAEEVLVLRFQVFSAVSLLKQSLESSIICLESGSVLKFLHIM